MLFIAILMSSCIKDYMSHTYVKMKNNTVHKIELKPYIGGEIDLNKAFTLNPNSEKIIESQSEWGKVKIPFAFGEYFVYIDSVVVVWNDEYKVVYLGDDYLTDSKKINYNDSLSNFFLLNSYEEVLVENHKEYSIWDLNFHFTESDYEYAKE